MPSGAAPPPPGGGPALIALAASVFLAQRSLYDHVARVPTPLRRGLEAARRAVAMIVGRDPDSLDEAGVCRAAIESCAENFSDGVVAPALWFALFGAARARRLQGGQHRGFDDRPPHPPA